MTRKIKDFNLSVFVKLYFVLLLFNYNNIFAHASKIPSRSAKTRRIRDQKRYRANADTCRIVVHTFQMQVSLSSNGHEKTKETNKF